MKPAHFLVVLICTAGCSFAAIASANSDEDGCSDVLRLAGRDITSRQRDLAVTIRLRDNYCSGKDVKQSVNVDSAAKAIVEGVPFSSRFGLGASKSKVENFCKLSQTDYETNSVEFDNASTVARESVAAWSACKALSQKGIKMLVQSIPPLLTLELRKSGQDPVILRGVDYSSSDAVCTIPPEVNGAPETVANSTTVVEIKRASWTLTCHKTTTTPARFPAFPIAIRTDLSPFAITIPEESSEPWISVGELKRQVSYLVERVGNFDVRKGEIPFPAQNLPSPVCAGVRGANGKVQFNPPMPTKPEVIAAVSSIDAARGEGPRLAISISNITKEGFDYSFVTWCDTSMSGASANWLAVSR